MSARTKDLPEQICAALDAVATRGDAVKVVEANTLGVDGGGEEKCGGNVDELHVGGS